MYPKLAIAAVCAVAGSFATAPAAQAHNVSVSPRFGELYQPFTFTGTLWQPYKRVTVLYDESADGSIDQRTSVGTNRYGNFRFRWNGENVADTHRMCFRQYDSRYRFQRTFTKCRLFTASD
jgi:hypothetical protein